MHSKNETDDWILKSDVDFSYLFFAKFLTIPQNPRQLILFMLLHFFFNLHRHSEDHMATFQPFFRAPDGNHIYYPRKWLSMGGGTFKLLLVEEDNRCPFMNYFRLELASAHE